MIEETLRTKTGQMTDVEARIEPIKEDLVRIGETVGLGIVVDQPLATTVKREGVITVKNQDIL